MSPGRWPRVRSRVRVWVGVTVRVTWWNFSDPAPLGPSPIISPVVEMKPPTSSYDEMNWTSLRED